jgi:hypothetical protein
MAAFEHERDTIISQADISSLPSLKDREARANTILKAQKNEIKECQNNTKDLEYLQKAINLKLKNLSRLNTDIKIQAKLMDNQVKLNTPFNGDYAARSLADELSKSTFGKDIFENMDTMAEEFAIEDPSKELDINKILNTNDENVNEDDCNLDDGELPPSIDLNDTPDNLSGNRLENSIVDPQDEFNGIRGNNPLYTIEPPNKEPESPIDENLIDIDSVLNIQIPEQELAESIVKNIKPEEKEPERLPYENLIDLDKILNTQEPEQKITEPIIKDVEPKEPENALNENLIDIDQIINTKKQELIEPEIKNIKPEEEKSEQATHQVNKNPTDIDIDSLLAQFN